MRRTLAFPEAETPSYCPVEIRSIMSSEVAPSFVFTLQSVCLVNRFAQDLSAYPAQMTRLTLPSPLALACMSCSDDPRPLICVLALLLPLLPPPPQPAARNASAPPSATTTTSGRGFRLIFLIRSPPSPPARRRTC